MKNILIFIFFIVPSFVQAQKKVIVYDSISLKTCKDGIEKATSDFNNNIYNSYSFGLTVEIIKKEEEGFSDFYRKYLMENYSINIENRGCVVTPFFKCYSETSDKLILQKFGNNIFIRTRKEARKLFSRK